jgi:DNA repair protein
MVCRLQSVCDFLGMSVPPILSDNLNPHEPFAKDHNQLNENQTVIIEKPKDRKNNQIRQEISSIINTPSISSTTSTSALPKTNSNVCSAILEELEGFSGEKQKGKKCCNPFIDKFLFDNFGECICFSCKLKNQEKTAKLNLPDIYRLISKQEAIKEYLLPDDAFQLFKFINKANPHNAHWIPMKLYLTKHIEQYSLLKFGTREKLQEEKTKREAKKYERLLEKNQALLEEKSLEFRNMLENKKTIIGSGTSNSSSSSSSSGSSDSNITGKKRVSLTSEKLFDDERERDAGNLIDNDDDNEDEIEMIPKQVFQKAASHVDRFSVEALMNRVTQKKKGKEEEKEKSTSRASSLKNKKLSRKEKLLGHLLPSILGDEK